MDPPAILLFSSLPPPDHPNFPQQHHPCRPPLFTLRALGGNNGGGEKDGGVCQGGLPPLRFGSDLFFLEREPSSLLGGWCMPSELVVVLVEVVVLV